MLLSFAQFEREVTGERIRDKIAASKKKGMWMGGNVPLGYDASERSLAVNPAEAETVRCIFALYRELGCVRRVKEEADRLGLRTKCSTTTNGTERGGKPFSRGHLYTLLSNPIYTGHIAHKLTQSSELATRARCRSGVTARLTGGPVIVFISGRLTMIFGLAGSAISMIDTVSLPAGCVIVLPVFSSNETI